MRQNQQVLYTSPIWRPYLGVEFGKVHTRRAKLTAEHVNVRHLIGLLVVHYGPCRFVQSGRVCHPNGPTVLRDAQIVICQVSTKI